MHNSVFGEFNFNTGWRANTDIVLFEEDYGVTVKAAAYFEKDGITTEQEAAFGDYFIHKKEFYRIIEKLLLGLESKKVLERFVPQMLLFKRDGSFALLFDDKEDADGGIAVCLAPKAEVVSQDEYL